MLCRIFRGRCHVYCEWCGVVMNVPVNVLVNVLVNAHVNVPVLLCLLACLLGLSQLTFLLCTALFLFRLRSSYALSYM
jgi:hypothetical protein